MQLLLNYGASIKHYYDKDIQKKLKNGDLTVLHTAVRCNNYKLCELFLKHDVNINESLVFDDYKCYNNALQLALALHINNKKLIELLVIKYAASVKIPLKYLKIKELDNNNNNNI